MRQVYEFLLKKVGLKEGDVIVIGVSGGPDSMALLFLCLMIRKKIPISLVVGHVNHNVRKESVKEAKFLEDYCIKNDVLFESMKIEEYSNDNFHNEARNIRYHFFEELVHKYNGKYLMTAHHGDDLMETILMRLVRGSTLKGYAGFQELVKMDGYTIIRPLVFVTKLDILNFVYEHKIPYVTDKSNFKDKYTRNRYRKKVLPFLKQEEKDVHRKFYQFSNLLYKYNEYLSKEVDKVYNKIYQDKTLFLDEFLVCEKLLQERIIARILEDIYHDDMLMISSKHVDLLFSLIYSKKKNSYLYFPNNIKVVKEYDKLHFTEKVEEIDSYEMELDNFVVLPNEHYIEKVEEIDTNGNDVCRLDSSEIQLPLYVRTRKHGDKLSLLGSCGHKKVKDVFIDSKVPASKRELWPVVVDSKGEVIWIPGIKKSKFIKKKSEKYDIIYKYN